MFLVIIIDVIVITTLVFVAVRKGVEQALPYFVFFVVLLPQESRLRLEGTFDLYSQRVALAALVALFLVYRKAAAIHAIPFRRLICLHIGWLTISTVFSIVVVTSVKQLLAQVLEYYLLYYILFKAI